VDRQRAALPNRPGVYLYADESGNVLYVGKAKDLRKRVGSYFTKSHGARTHALVMRIANIEVFELSSEREALVFESTLIKRHRPPFNVMLRDDKSYPWIGVTLSDQFPRVIFTREKHRPGTRYFGPYSSARRVRMTLDLLNRVFPYRPCEGPTPGRQSGVPCLDYHIDRCAAPCVGLIDQEAYRAVIDEVMQVLDGDVRGARTRLTEQMQAASAELEFERAARLRNRLRDLEAITDLQQAERPGQGSFDVVGVAVGPASANVQVLQVRDGMLADRRSHFLDNVEDLDAGTVLTQFLLAYYAPGRPVPPVIVVREGVTRESDRAVVAEELGLQREAAVEVRPALRGEKRRLVDLARRNAEHALAYDSIRERTRVERRQLALEQLRDELGLESLPLRIECYDISNLQDEAPVAAMTVFEDGRPRKDHYRKFAMRHTGGQDDFAMMHEVITRRFRRLVGAPQEPAGEVAQVRDTPATPLEGAGPPAEPAGAAEAADGPDDSFSSFPNLVVIDGGKGQLGAAMHALHELGVERVSLCSLAKQEELVFLPGRSEPVRLDRHGPALHVLQRIRDEAHRFGLGYHRVRRASERHASILDSLEGVGDVRRRALLTFFGSPEKVMSATLDELESVPGLPGKVARRIYDQLYRLGTAATDVVGDEGAEPPPGHER
jgi:excinuclease ABC subunit C